MAVPVSVLDAVLVIVLVLVLVLVLKPVIVLVVLVVLGHGRACKARVPRAARRSAVRAIGGHRRGASLMEHAGELGIDRAERFFERRLQGCASAYASACAGGSENLRRRKQAGGVNAEETGVRTLCAWRARAAHMSALAVAAARLVWDWRSSALRREMVAAAWAQMVCRRMWSCLSVSSWALRCG